MCVVASMDYHIRQHGTHLSLKVTPHRMSVLRAPFGFTEAAVRFVPLVNRENSRRSSRLLNGTRESFIESLIEKEYTHLLSFTLGCLRAPVWVDNEIEGDRSFAKEGCSWKDNKIFHRINQANYFFQTIVAFCHSAGCLRPQCITMSFLSITSMYWPPVFVNLCIYPRSP